MKQEILYGGQAVIEGVMMRGADRFAVACRRSSGTVVLTCEPVPKILRPTWQKIPLVRGAFALVDAMTLGTRAMFWAARVAESDVSAPVQVSIRHAEELAGPALGSAVAGRDPLPAGSPAAGSRVSDVAIGSAMVTGMLLAMALVFVLPNLGLSVIKAAGVHRTWQLGCIDAVLRFGIFFGYIGLVGRMSHVRRVFQYHGAEHKTINALESYGESGLSLDTARSASRLHPRCGTSFAVIVLLLSTLAIVPFYGLPAYERVPIHLLLALPIAGIAFELLRLAGRYRRNPVWAALARPGMWTQLLTTREPDDSQIEVAITSLRAVLEADRELRPELLDPVRAEAAAVA